MRNFKILITLFLTLGLLGIIPKSHAAITDPLTTIELETPVHFLAADGSDLLVESGTYAIEPAEEWIRLMSGERHDAVLIEATKGTHELELEEPMGLSVPGETEEESDLHHVTLLLPGGQSLDATGTYSGIRHRGFLQNTFNNVKKKARQAYKKAKSTAKKTVSKAKSTARKATKHVKKQTQKAVSRAKKGVQHTRNAALRAKRHVEKTARKVASHVKSGIRKAKQTVTGGSGQWTKFSQTASVAARKEAQEWLRKAYIDNRRCKVMVVSAIGTPGVLKSRYTFQGKISKALQAAGASKTIAQGWDTAFKKSWEQWAKYVTIPGLPFYPAFASFPGPKAPPLPNVPFPLSALVSKGVIAMSPPALSQKVLAKLDAFAKHQKVKNAVHAFANDLGGRFAMCMAGCQLMNVMGSGPVPGFAPPSNPVGPVLNGTCTGGLIPNPPGFQ